MTRTFLVAVSVESGELLADIAAEIENLLSRQFPVESVQPWASPGQPSPQNQQTNQQQTQT